MQQVLKHVTAKQLLKDWGVPQNPQAYNVKGHDGPLVLVRRAGRGHVEIVWGSGPRIPEGFIETVRDRDLVAIYD